MTVQTLDENRYCELHADTIKDVKIIEKLKEVGMYGLWDEVLMFFEDKLSKKV